MLFSTPGLQTILDVFALSNISGAGPNQTLVLMLQHHSETAQTTRISKPADFQVWLVAKMASSQVRRFHRGYIYVFLRTQGGRGK